MDCVSLPPISTLDDHALAELLADLGEAPWRARQVRDATWQPWIGDFADVRQLPAGLRQSLAERSSFSAVEVVARAEADAGCTIKLLCRLEDGQTVETVAMESPETPLSRRRGTVCVTTQVGCAVGCPFCATGRLGLRRSCTAAEVVDQVRAASRALRESGFGGVTNVVFMGMGEPLHAYAATVGAIRVLTTAGGISPRRVTVSTSGVVPAIDRLADEEMPLRLAISLHAATDELRDRLVPLNRRHPLAEVEAAAIRYTAASGRRVTFEWCLIGGVNDSPQQAAALAELARRCRAHVNVIPMNRIEGSPWGPPPAETAQAFLAGLQRINVTVRDTRGAESDAACGQLRADLEDRRFLLPDGTLAAPRRV